MVLNITEESNKGIACWINNVGTSGGEQFGCSEEVKA